MSTSEAQKRATIKYMKNNLEEIRFRVPKGQKDQIKQFASAQGKSMRAYIMDLIQKDMQK